MDCLEGGKVGKEPHAIYFDKRDQAQPDKDTSYLDKIDTVCQNVKVNDYLHFPFLSSALLGQFPEVSWM